MWWRLIVSVLSIVVIIIIILQQFDDMNALQSPIFIRSSRNLFEHPLMDYPTHVRKSANLHIKDGSHGLIYIFKIGIRHEHSPVTNFHPIFAKFF